MTQANGCYNLLTLGAHTRCQSNLQAFAVPIPNNSSGVGFNLRAARVQGRALGHRGRNQQESKEEPP